MCGSVGRKSTWEQITFYVETIKQSTTIKGLENYGLNFSEAMEQKVFMNLCMQLTL